MDRVYFLENQGVSDSRSHTPLFQLILKLELPEDSIYSDMDLARPELHTALETLKSGDKFIVRSIQDLADSQDDLQSVLQRLDGQGVELVSLEEPYLNGVDYFNIWCGVLSIISFYKARARDAAYQRAREEGRVGRPPKAEIQKAIKLYNSGCFTVAEIEKQTGVSKSTLYRYKGKET